MSDRITGPGDFVGEWHNAPDFAEVAEALGVRTIDVMAMLPSRVVIYSVSDSEPDPMVYASTLGRDADGILVAAPGREVCRVSQFTSGIDEHMRKLEERGDLPPRIEP